MRTQLSIALAVIIFASVAFAADKTFPKFNLENTKGKKVTLDEVLAEGKPVMVTFWATYCKPCKKELTKLVEKWNSYGETERPFNVIALCEDGPRSKRKAISMAETENYDAFHVLFDESGTVKQKAGVADIPELFILKPDGSIFYRHVGYNAGDEVKTFDQLEKLLAETNASGKSCH